MSERTQQETVELLREVKSVLSSINRSRHHQVEIEGDDPAYWQREEWVNWAVGEVLPRVEAALDAHIGEANEKALQGAPADHIADASNMVPKCGCHTCQPVTLENMRFVACPECGNKRCPKANDHRNACTGSNEPGQPGSAYQAPKGWRLVPEYPTDSMLAHGQDLALIQRHDGSAGYLANLEQVWAVMVCAAPKPSQGEQA